MSRRSSIAHGWALRAVIALVLAGTSFARPEARYSATGLVLKVEPGGQVITVSCDAIAGFMDAMVMSFPVRSPDRAERLEPGTRIAFTLVAGKDFTYAENVKVQAFESLEQDPAQARRLHMLEELMAPSAPAARPLRVGDAVPNFRLIDQAGRPVTLEEFAGKVVAITFVYTRCPFPDYCYRLSNNFGQLQKRFQGRMGKDLILLSIVIDPTHDQPAELKEYARIWKADIKAWHFLSGSLPEIKRVAEKFDMHFYPDEALFVHSFRTAVVDRQGKLAANIEGNQFSAQQLGDLVQTILARDSAAHRAHGEE
ncbi:MAG TPA: SCO family protein [Terriglobales bacterium]|nr:SCO family protein [Terriglobales bacterium]